MRARTLMVVAMGVAIAGTSAAQSDEYVSGYTRRDGTYVQPYMRTAPNGTQSDNYSTRGNINPYTGQEGTRTATPSYIPTPLPQSGAYPQSGISGTLTGVAGGN